MTIQQDAPKPIREFMNAYGIENPETASHMMIAESLHSISTSVYNLTGAVMDIRTMLEKAVEEPKNAPTPEPHSQFKERISKQRRPRTEPRFLGQNR